MCHLGSCFLRDCNFPAYNLCDILKMNFATKKKLWAHEFCELPPHLFDLSMKRFRTARSLGQKSHKQLLSPQSSPGHIYTADNTGKLWFQKKREWGFVTENYEQFYQITIPRILCGKP